MHFLASWEMDHLVSIHAIVPRCFADELEGTVYRAKDQTKSNRLVAVKLEAHNAPYPSLEYEAQVYKRMNIKNKNGYVQPLIWYGDLDAKGGKGMTVYKALVMPLLGPSIQNLWASVGMRLGFCSIVRLAKQMVRFIRFCLIH